MVPSLTARAPDDPQALGGIPLKAKLPGLKGGNRSRIFERVLLRINPAANAWELARHGDLHDEALVIATNPLNVSLSFYAMDVDFFYEGKWVGDVRIPSLPTPIWMAPYEANFMPDVRFPVRLSAPTGTLFTMLERMLVPGGSIYVDMQLNLTFAAGNQIYSMPHSDYGVEVKLHL